MTVRRVFTLFALLAALTPGRSPAQVTTTGNIRVAVTEGGLPVPGATVTAAAADAATTRVAVTDTRGLAELAALNPSARYRRHRRAPGISGEPPGGLPRPRGSDGIHRRHVDGRQRDRYRRGDRPWTRFSTARRR